MSGDKGYRRPPTAHLPGECLNCDVLEAVYRIFNEEPWLSRLKADRPHDGNKELTAISQAFAFVLRDVLDHNPSREDDVINFAMQTVTNLTGRPLVVVTGNIARALMDGEAFEEPAVVEIPKARKLDS